MEAVRARYNPLEVLTEAGISAVSQRDFLIPQTVTIDQELSHLATRSYFLAIPELEKPEILRKLEAHLKAEYSSGCITRVLDPFVVYGRK